MPGRIGRPLREPQGALRGFDFAVPDEQYARIAGENADLRSALEARMHQLRSRADQLDAFAAKLRGR
jgi:hypothetical protein